MPNHIRHDPCDDTWTITLNGSILGVCDTIDAARSLLNNSLHRGDCPECESTVDAGVCQGACKAVLL